MRGAILAGGAASRYGGRAKGLERVGGERLLDRAVEAVQIATGQLPLLIANEPDADTWRPGLSVVPDVIPQCGSLGGIYTAVTSGEGSVLVVAWDMPFLKAELLGALIEDADDYDVFLPESSGPLGVEPLCGVYGPFTADPIRKSLAQEDFRTTAFHPAVRVGTLPLERVATFGDPEVLFFNVNAPEDRERAEQHWRALQGA